MYKPGTSTGNYAQHFETRVGLGPRDGIPCTQCACQPRTCTIRTVLSWISPSSQLMRLRIKNSRNSQNWPFAIDAVGGSAEWTPTYYAHLVAAGSDGFVAPLPLYLEAFPCIKEDAILGITICWPFLSVPRCVGVDARDGAACMRFSLQSGGVWSRWQKKRTAKSSESAVVASANVPHWSTSWCMLHGNTLSEMARRLRCLLKQFTCRREW